VVAKADATAQASNTSPVTIYAVPSTGAGSYRACGYVVVTQAATTSSTMPAINLQWTDLDTLNAGTNVQIGTTSTGNTVGTTNSPHVGGAIQCTLLQVAANSNIQWNMSGYASSGVTPMQYAIHIKLEYLGN
jgi:hypothetical protein